MNKKYYLFAAAAAVLSLTACSSDDDAVQTKGAQTAAVDQAVSFDTYTAGTTRAGDPVGVLTTDKMKTPGKGFGVFAFTTNNNADYTTTLTPDFMYNEHVHWSGGWTYSPLKYWPNETTADMLNATGHAVSVHTDKVSFFAYAPWVETKTGGLTSSGASDKITTSYHASETSGIMAITTEATTGDPRVEWKVSADPDNNVDLLWGVAPAGFGYTAVNGTDISREEGKPLVNMVKPDKDQKIKFLFQHALSRIGLTVVSAIDQIAAGGSFDINESRVLIDEVKIYGDFGTHGVLNLNNGTANVAKWEDVVRTASTEGSPLFTINATNGYLNPDLRYDASKFTGTGTIEDTPSKFDELNQGVRPSEQDLMVGGPDPSKKVSESATAPAFDWGKTYYKQDGNDYVLANVTYTNDADLYTFDEATNKLTQAYTSSNTSVKLDANSEKLYTISTGSAATGTLTAAQYYHKTGSAGSYKYELITATAGDDAGTDEYYLASGFNKTLITGIPDYASAIYWTDLLPRYFMVIPSDVTPTPTTINVKITYHVVTKDTKLTGNVSNITNAITKTTSIQLQNGKSYNLKLILGLTSVKLDATVKDWEVADETEINLPRNEE
ncbi:MAG: hypothetical protein IJS97_05025 [Prevotella sp.]|nr:hypothetical protein [Prevotella sp.]